MQIKIASFEWFEVKPTTKVQFEKDGEVIILPAAACFTALKAIGQRIQALTGEVIGWDQKNTIHDGKGNRQVEYTFRGKNEKV